MIFVLSESQCKGKTQLCSLSAFQNIFYQKLIVERKNLHSTTILALLSDDDLV